MYRSIQNIDSDRTGLLELCSLQNMSEKARVVFTTIHIIEKTITTNSSNPNPSLGLTSNKYKTQELPLDWIIKFIIKRSIILCCTESVTFSNKCNFPNLFEMQQTCMYMQPTNPDVLVLHQNSSQLLVNWYINYTEHTVPIHSPQTHLFSLCLTCIDPHLCL